MEGGLPSRTPGRASDAEACPTSSLREAPGCPPSRDATRYATSSKTGIADISSSSTGTSLTRDQTR